MHILTIFNSATVLRLLMLLLVIYGLPACGGNPELTADKHVANAKDYMDSGNTRAAIIELKNALQKAPENPEARWLLGQVYLEQGLAVEAEKELRRGVELGLAPEAAEIPLTRALIMQGEYQQVLDRDIELGSFPEPDRAMLMSLHGHASLGLGELEKAETLYDMALTLQENSPDAKTGKAQLAIAQNDFEAARNSLAEALETTPDFASAWSLLGLIEFYEGNLEAAEAAYTQAMQDPVYRDQSQYKRILLRIRLARFEQAAEDISALRKRIKNAPNLDYAEGLLHFEQRQFAAAQTLFEAALGLNPRHASALFYAGATHAFLGNPSTAKEYLHRYLALNPGNLTAKRLLAQVELQSGNPAEAEELAQEILRQAPDNVRTMHLLADALSRISNHDAAVDVLKKVVATQPESTDAQRRLGEALLKEGEVDEGLRNLQELLGDDANSHKAVEGIIRQHIKRGELDKALEVARDYRDQYPDSAPAHVLLGVAHLSRNEMLEASKAFQQALEIEPGHVPANHGMAMIAIRVNDLKRAESYYREALKYHPDDYVTMMNLAKLAASQRNYDEAIPVLRDVIDRHPGKLQPRLELSRLYLRSGDTKNGITLLLESRSRYPEDKNLLGLLAEAQLATGRYAAAKSTLQQLETLVPEDPKVIYALSEVYRGLGDQVRMREALERTAVLDPDFAPAQIGLARIAISDKNVQVAKLRVDNLRTLVRSDNTSLLQLEAQLAELAGDMPAAVTAQQKLFNLQQTNVNLRQLTLLQWKAGLKEDAVRQYEHWVREHPEDTQALLELAQRYLDSERTEDAITTYQSVLVVDTENALALNNLASLLRDADAEAALEYAERAFSLYPEDPVVMDTLADALLLTGHTERAARMNERALAKQPDNPVFLERRAQILDAQGKRD